MKLPFFKKKQEDTGFYLALLLTDEKASAVILHEQEGKVKIIGSHEEFFSKPLDHVHIEELIEVIDKALSRAEESLPPSIETHKTVFGLKESWIEEETKKIKKQHLAQLKKVCDNLDLTPIGFMVTTEAIINMIQEEEGAPLSAIMAELSKTGVTLTLLRGGKKIEFVNGPFKEFTPAVTVDMLLRHFTVPVLPARLILFDSDSTEKLAQQFISHQWSKGLPFLHVPQISVLPAGFDAKSVAFGAAAQMGFELVGIDNDHPQNLQQTTASDEHSDAGEESEEAADALLDEKIEEKDDTPEEAPAAETMVKADNFGFVTDADIAEVTPAVTKEPEVHHAHQTHPEPQVTSSHHHKTYASEMDTSESHHTALTQKHYEPSIAYEDENAMDEENVDSEEERNNRFAFLSNIKLPGFGDKKGIKLPTFGKNKKLLLPLLIVGSIISIIVALSVFYIFNVEAKVILTMKPNMVNQTAKTIFSTAAGSDFSKNIIAANNLTATVDGETSVEATGKKDIGEKAKGTVTVFNNSNEKVSLSAGSEIKASNGHTFLLEKDVTVASASGDIFSGTKPGTADVSVIAKEIGSEQNVPSNTKFSVGGNSSLAAKNDSAFSGGSKKSVTVVSKDDYAKLRTELPKKLQTKAKSAIEQKASNSETLLPYFAMNSLEKASYDKKVDEEAKTVKLRANVVFDGMAYENDELVEYAKAILNKDQSEEIKFADNSIKVTVNDAKEKGEKELEATVQIEAGVLPKLNTSEIAEGLHGKSYAEAQETLSGLTQIDKSEITFTPWIPLLPQIFPSLPNKITVEIVTQ